MSKQFKDRLAVVAKHFDVSRGSMSVQQWVEAVKAKAGGKKGIEELYGEITAPRQETKVEPATVKHGDADNKVVETSAVIVPGNADATSPATETTVDDRMRHAVVVQVASPQPQIVTVEAPSKVVGQSRGVLVLSAASWCQTFALGALVGVLVSRHVLRTMGF